MFSLLFKEIRDLKSQIFEFFKKAEQKPYLSISETTPCETFYLPPKIQKIFIISIIIQQWNSSVMVSIVFQ